jgi:signal transduction histidine kinase
LASALRIRVRTLASSLTDDARVVALGGADAERGADAVDLETLLAFAHAANNAQEVAAGLSWAEKASVVAQRHSEQPVAAGGAALAALERAIALFHLGRARESLAACEAGIEAAPDDVHLLAELHAQAAVALRKLGLRVRALERNLVALDRLEDRADDEALVLLATLHNNVAMLHQSQGDTGLALQHLSAASGYADRGGEAMLRLQLHTNLGRTLIEVGRLDEAAAHLDEALELAADAPLAFRARVQGGAAALCIRQGRLDEALALAREAAAYWSASEHTYMAVYAQLILGEALVAVDDDDAEEVLGRVMEHAEQAEYRDVSLGGSARLADFMEQRGRFEEACHWHRAHARFQKRHFDESRNHAIEELRLNHAFEAKEREAALLRLRTTELEQLVQKRTARLARQNAELQRARDAAEEANRTKSTFLAVVSHELRTPLNAITGYTELIQDTLPVAPPVAPDDLADVREDLGRVEQAAGQLMRLIDRILAITDLESASRDAVEREPTDLDVLVRAEVDGRGAEIRVSGAIGEVCTAAQHVAEALSHVLDNAERFGRSPDGALDCVVAISRTDDGVQLAVSDRGPGFDPDALQRLLQPFSQRDMSYTRRHGGLGLGLALARLHLEQVGGRLSAISQPGAGTTFVLTLPD